MIVPSLNVFTPGCQYAGKIADAAGEILAVDHPFVVVRKATVEEFLADYEGRYGISCPQDSWMRTTPFLQYWVVLTD